MRFKLAVILGMSWLLVAAALADTAPLPDMPVANAHAFSTPAGVAYEHPVTTQQEDRTRAYFALGSAAECAVGISMSGNHARSAQIGIPVTLTANLLAKKFGARHPKLSAALQIIAPISCYSGWNKDASKALTAAKTVSDPPTTTSGTTNGGSSNPPSGGGTTPP